jgi:hypothetical protein
MPIENVYGHAGLLTTPGDLLTWNSALSAGRLGPFVQSELERRSALSNGRRLNYAKGLEVHGEGASLEYSHGGATAGYRAWLARYPASRISIAVMCNSAEADAEAIGRSLVKTLGQAARPVGLGAPGATLEGRAGTFISERSGLPLVILSSGGTLALEGDGPLLEIDPGRYRRGTGEIAFLADGRILARSEDGDRVFYRRAGQWSPSRSDLDHLTGIFSSDEAQAAYRLAVSDDRLVLQNVDRPGIVFPLQPLEHDAFRLPFGVVRLVRDARGSVSYLRVVTPRVHSLLFRRDDQPRP